MVSRKPKSYVLCTTPRTGSTLLCSLLKATCVVGYPESYFRSQDVEARVDEWKIRRADGSFSFSDFLTCVLRRGCTENGVFAVRVMWGTMKEITEHLRSTGMTGVEREVLSGAFGPTRFVYLERKEAVAQAISRLLAEQTKIWHISDTRDVPTTGLGVRYDRAAIQHFLRETKDHVQSGTGGSNKTKSIRCA